MMALVFSMAGFLLGIALGSFFEIRLSFILFTVALAVIIFLYEKGRSSKNAKIFILIFFLAGTACGLSRIYFSELRAPSKLEQYVGQKISAEGIVVSEPDVRDNNTKLTVRVSRAKTAASPETVRPGEKVLISVPLYPEYHYGDLISFSVKLSEPKQIESDDGRVFDYKNYLRVRGIWYTGSFAQVKLVSVGHGSYIKTALFGLKRFFTDAINRVIPAPESALLAGLLLGTKQSLGRELLDEFSRAGVSHVVVLSGYNITIVAESVMGILGFLSGAMSFWIGCAVIILFTLLSGGGASAWRASLMVLVALFVRRGNRQFNAGYALALVIVIMLLWNPLLLIFDPSFQLSILATIGIIFVSPIIEPYLSRVPKKYGMQEVVAATLATQLTVLPYLIYSNGIFSLVALPVNVLILGTIPLTMFLGFVTGVLGMISFYLSFLPGLLSYALLKYQLTVVHLGVSLPLGWFTLPAFSMWFVVVVYILIVATLRNLDKKKAAFRR